MAARSLDSVPAPRFPLRSCATVCVVFALAVATGSTFAVEQSKPYVAPAKTGINKDAMTMQECRDRLAAPKSQRPPSDDPGVDKDAVCDNMLGGDKAAHKRQTKHAKAASAP